MSSRRKNKSISQPVTKVKTLEGISVTLSETAFVKMAALIEHFDGEIGWHGVVRRPKADVFKIEDIFVYPQTVSSAAIVTGQFEYSKWLMDLDEETFLHLRFHGHSHVNFGCTPSGVDIKHMNSISEKLEGDMFYLFMIINKKYDSHIVLFDRLTRKIYTNRIQLFVETDGAKTIFTQAKISSYKERLSVADISEFIHHAQSIATI